MQVIHDKKLYDSRSELIRELLQEQKHNKSKIAEVAGVVPQTVQYIYNKMVAQGKITDYYPAFIAERKKARLKRLSKQI